MVRVPNLKGDLYGLYYDLGVHLENNSSPEYIAEWLVRRSDRLLHQYAMAKELNRK